MRRMTFGKPDAGKPPVRFDEGRGWDRKLTTTVCSTPLSQLRLLYFLAPRKREIWCAPVKLIATWVGVPPVELDGSRPKRGVREEAVRPNHKRDADGTVGLQRR